MSADFFSSAMVSYGVSFAMGAMWTALEWKFFGKSAAVIVGALLFSFSFLFVNSLLYLISKRVVCSFSTRVTLARSMPSCWSHHM